MEKLKIFFVNNKLTTVGWLTLSSLLVAIIYFLSTSLISRRETNPLTVPIISPTPIITEIIREPLDTTNPFNPDQKLNFFCGSLTFDAPQSVDLISIRTPLVNPTSITSIANRLAFTTLERMETDEESYLWVNPKASLFGSPTQNQILFNSTEPIPDTTTIVTEEQVLNLARNFLTILLGEPVLNTFDQNPEVKYLNLRIDTEDEPNEVSPQEANIISVSFKQQINNRELINLGLKRGETVSIAFDTTGKLFILYVYGGYSSFSVNGKVDIINFPDMKTQAPSSAMRISYAEDIDSERAFTDADTINVYVRSVDLGYFQRSDNDVFPVYIVRGTMNARGLTDFPATYIVPAIVK